MRNPMSCTLAALLLAALAGCSDTGQPEQASMAYGAAAPAAKMAASAQHADAAGGEADLAAMLAYEHSASVQIPAEQIPGRLDAVQSACTSSKFGACVVLNVHQQGGDAPWANVTVRIVPDGVEPMIGLAGDDARLGSRSTRAEDLAVAVRDNAQVQDRLRREMERLQEFQQRPDLAVADMISLSERIASVEAQLESAAQQEAQYRRRIDTQLLTLDFRPPGGETGRSEVGQALRDVGATLSLGTAWTIRAVAFLAPLVLVLGVFVAVIRRLRRRRRTPS